MFDLACFRPVRVQDASFWDVSHYHGTFVFLEHQVKDPEPLEATKTFFYLDYVFEILTSKLAANLSPAAPDPTLNPTVSGLACHFRVVNSTECRECPERFSDFKPNQLLFLLHSSSHLSHIA